MLDKTTRFSLALILLFIAPSAWGQKDNNKFENVRTYPPPAKYNQDDLKRAYLCGRQSGYAYALMHGTTITKDPVDIFPHPECKDIENALRPVLKEPIYK